MSSIINLKIIKERIINIVMIYRYESSIILWLVILLTRYDHIRTVSNGFFKYE
mgnify:CR=1 FL=1